MTSAASPPVQHAPYEVIIVLGAAVWQGGQPSPALRRRMQHAIVLMQRGHGKVLLCTGGLGTYPPAEAHVMQRLARDAGIPEAHILLEAQATSTFESAQYCSHIIRQQGWARVLVVTDRYHLTRALLAFRGCGIRAHGSAAPAGRPRRRWAHWWHAYLREWLACAWYALRIVASTARRWRCRAPRVSKASAGGTSAHLPGEKSVRKCT